jgi:outer membrane receptor protein involved in Fe transport
MRSSFIDLGRLRAAVAAAMCMLSNAEVRAAEISHLWHEGAVHAYEGLECDCPGCRAYRARISADAFISDLVGIDGPGRVTMAQANESIQPFDPGSPIGSGQASGGDLSLASLAGVDQRPEFSSLVGFAEFNQAANPATETVTAAAAAPAGTVIPAQTVGFTADPEPGAVMRDTASSTSVTGQRRNPISYDPHVRGFRYGQILSRVNGVWSPVRPDLDSPISKVDTSLIEDIAIIPGPYASRYGPGFSFIDVQTTSTPRYQGGSETHARVGATTHDNGGQLQGRSTIYGGGSDWGFIGHYGSRTGSDYESGNGTLIPSSYNNQTFLGQVGYDLTPHSSLEVRYDRLDQTDTEYALQFFDINFLGNDSTSLRYTDVDPGGPFSRVDVDAWYNRTRYNGDNLNASKAPVVDRVRASLTASLPGSDYSNVNFVGDTFGDRMLTGGRAMATLGDVDSVHARTGTDFRYEDQEIQENYWIYDTIGQFPPLAFGTNLPKSWLLDTGAFSELIIPMNSYWRTTAGVRADVVDADARASDLRSDTNLSPSQLSQSDTLYGFYLVNDVVLTQNWNTRLGFGHAQRPPTLIERYSDGVFLGIIQSGFSRVIGDPNLDKERLWQIDWSLSADYERFRGRGTLYNSWIIDFSTYSGNLISSPADARLLRSTNTDLATLAGFELYGEGDVSEYVTLFSAMHYVQGTDQQIDAPLWGIPPLDARAGLRLHDSDRGRIWGAELAVRMVDRQDRFGVIRNVFDPNVLLPIETATAGFTTVDLRSYYNYTQNISFVGGILNLLDKNYLEHLDLRLPAQVSPGGQGIPTLPAIAALSPGFTVFTGMEVNY